MPEAKSSLPTLLSAARLAAGFGVAALVLAAQQYVFTAGSMMSVRLYGLAALLFIAAALTDWLDGALARRLDAVTPFGAALDHIADKVLVAATFIALIAAGTPLDFTIAALILIGRDLAVAGLRETLGDRLPVDGFGKAKAAAVMAGLAMFLAFRTWSILSGGDAVSDALLWLSRVLIWIAALLALWSGGRYLAAARAPRNEGK